MKEFLEANKRRWNELADIHFQSSYYNVEDFRKGGVSISNLELNEVGNVQGKKLLHFQCHFGKDTLSWARLGAKVTGVDFSSRAINLANQLSKEIGINANFIESDILALDKTSLEPYSFDIVYTSHGSIYWLPALEKWATLISYYLKPAGFFYIADFHPTAMMFDDTYQNDWKVRYPYFHQKTPLKFEEDGSYANEHIQLKNKDEYGWVHNLGYIVNSLIESGLSIEFIHEYSFLSWKGFSFLKKKDDGWWHIPSNFAQVPLTFTLKAIKK